ncbi:MAG: AraC family transcriptional regulator, partial [Novosphingobium sp.]
CPPLPWSEQVRRTLTSHAADTPTLAACAAALGVSDRTLVRRMAAEGTRFGAVLDDHRRDLAMILARNNDMTAKDIARAVGFDSHQSLRRAFLRWTGLPLGRWRSGQADAPVQQQPS